MYAKISIDDPDEKLRACTFVLAFNTSLKNAESIKRLSRFSPDYTHSSDHLQR